MKHNPQARQYDQSVDHLSSADGPRTASVGDMFSISKGGLGAGSGDAYTVGGAGSGRARRTGGKANGEGACRV